MSHDSPEFEKHSDHKRRELAKQDANLSWGEVMEIILEERKEVWQALADLDKGENNE